MHFYCFELKSDVILYSHITFKMELLDQSTFTEDQKWILHLRINEQMSYRQIQASWRAAHVNEGDDLSSGALKTCFRRSSLALSWKKGKQYGREKFLSKPDVETLSQYIEEKCIDDDPTDAVDVLSEALCIRKKRQIKAIKFLNEIKCKQIAEELENEDIDTPARTWINYNLEDLCSKIRQARIVDYDRFFACTTDIVKSFFELSGPHIEDKNPALIFGADELGLDPSFKKKYIIPDHVTEFIAKSSPIQMPHFTIMFCHNIIGTLIPPFVILPQLKNCPEEIQKYINLGQIWCVSTDSGWQNRDSFLIWCINFINWLSSYRLTLYTTIREQKALLIIDGHTSRENPISLYILKINHIDVLVLPAHTTHLLQMFDVVLAKPFKKQFSRNFNRLFSENCLNDQSTASIIRECAIQAVIQSWSSVCNYQNCTAAANTTGTYPHNLEVILSQPFIHDLTEAEKELLQRRRHNNRLNINGKLVTDIQNLKEINESIHEKEAFKHLCVTGPVDYIPFCLEKSGDEFNDVNIFSKFHFYVSPTSPPVFF